MGFPVISKTRSGGEVLMTNGATMDFSIKVGHLLSGRNSAWSSIIYGKAVLCSVSGCGGGWERIRFSLWDGGEFENTDLA